MADSDEGPVRDWVGWEFLAAMALMAGGPIVMGIEKLLFVTPSSAFITATDWIGIGMIVVGILLVFHVNLVTALTLRLVIRHDRSLVGFVATRQVRYIVISLLTFLLATSLRKLDEAGSEGFVGAAAGVLGGLILIFTLDHRFMPRDESYD